MRLRTFAGLWIEAEPPPSLGPRPLALLAIVAAAGRPGISRDRVVGLLWPEVDEERARHALSQTLYILRRDAGQPVITGTTHLRLDPSCSSDITELQDATRAGDLERVAALYAGPFLEGFYLPGAPAFERWVDEERARLHQVVVRSIERLARQAEEVAPREQAVGWWQRLAELDPLSTTYALGHMRALAAVGNLTAALARARSHREALRWELEAEPEPAVRDLEAALRTELATHPHPAPPTPVLESTRAVRGVPPGPSAAAAARRWLVPAAGLALAAAGLTLWTLTHRHPLPFLAVGEIRINAAPDSSRPGAVLRDMLATSLGGIEGLQVVANSRIVELAASGTDPGAAAIKDAARRAGAAEIIEGELATEPGGLVLSLRRVALGSGVVRRGYVVRGTDRYAVVDSAAAEIARDLGRAPPAVMVASIRTSSPAAYALYDEGLRALYGYDGSAAYRLMTAALARDSTFAMAAYHAWQLSRSYADDSTSTAALRRVEHLAVRTIDRERLLIQASVAELEAPLATALAKAETLTVKYPTDPEGQILLGTVRFRAGDWAGAVAANEQAVRLDSLAGALSGPYCRICKALEQMADAYLWWDSAGAAERTARRLVALRPNDPGPWRHLVEPLFRQGRRVEAEAAADSAVGPTLSSTWAGPALHRDLLRWGQYDTADTHLIEDLHSRDPLVRADAWWLLILSLRDQGRLTEADSLIRGGLVPGSTARVPAQPGITDLALLALEMGRPQVSILAHRLDAVRAMHSARPPAVRARNIVWSLALAGTAHAAAGDTAEVRRLADSLEVLGRDSYYGRDAKLHWVLRGLLLQTRGNHAEAAVAFGNSLFSLTDGYTRTNLMLARSLLSLHRPTEAIAMLQSAIRGGVDGSNAYVSRTELHEALALAFEQAGQRDSARTHWQAVLSGWKAADPQFRDRYLLARKAVGGQSGG